MLLALWFSLALHVPVDKEVAHLRFHSAFWPNLHHTLYAASLSTGRPLGSPVKGTLTEGMTADERAAWEPAVAFYAREMASKDLRTGDGMSRINNVLAEAEDDGLSASAALKPEVLHEVSHGLVVERLDATLAAQAAAAGKDPGDLGHLALFYMVGEITRQAVAERQTAYTPFLYAAGVIDRGWPSQRGIVEARLKPYVDEGAMTMETAMKGWMQDGKLFAFRSGFWVNLHHFLYVLGRARNGAADSRRAAVVKAPADVEGLASRTENERAAWDESLHYYAGGLSTKDAIFDAALVDITRKLAAAPDDADPAALGLPPELASTLKLAAPVYRAVWWPRHARANAARRDDLQAFVDRHGAAAVKRLTSLYQTQWPARPRTIDLVAYANWAGAYSTDGGLIVFATTDEDLSGGLGLETLLHESSHQWDEEIERRLAVIAAKQGKPVPGGLSHAMIFYTSGAIVSELIPGHVPYADKSGIWTRGANPALKPLLDRYWRPYIRGAGTFEEAAAKLVDAR